MNTTMLDQLKSSELMPGLHFKLIHTDNMTLSFVEIDKGAILPEHAHPQEQVTIMQKGQLELTVGGETTLLEPGSVIHIPSNVVHSGVAHTECEVLDVFQPARDDLK